MTDPAVLAALCQKLGHGLEEVRLRALDSVLCKLDRGFLKFADLVTSKDFLVKLLEWFGFQPCPAQEKTLGLILRLLQQPGCENLVAQIGSQRILLALSTIRVNLQPNLCPLLDDIVGLTHRAETILAQSTTESDSDQRDCEGFNKESPPATQTESKGEGCFLDASLQEALHENSSLSDGTQPVIYARHNNPESLESIISTNVLKHLIFPWQPLISTDRHVLVAVENSLSNLEDRDQLLNTCSFLTDVMMRDFPSEVFLQRPAIVMTFMRLMKSTLLSQDNHLAKMIVTCLLTLTNALHCRLNFYQDPNMINQKQEKFFEHEDNEDIKISAESMLSNQENFVDMESLRRVPEWNDYILKPSDSRSNSSSKSSTQSRSFPQNDDCNERSRSINSQVPTDSDVSDESSLLRLQQCSLPQFCLLGMSHVFPHIDIQPDGPTLLYKLSGLLCHCVTNQIWLAPASDVIATDIATHLFEMLEKLGEVLLQDRSSIEGRLVQMRLLTITRHLLQCLVPLEVADRCLPRQLKSALCTTLFDGPLYAFFPSLHSDLRQYTRLFKNVRDVDSVKLFESTLAVAESLISAATLLNQEDLSDGSKVIKSIECALTSLSFHQDYKFIPLVFDSCSKFYNRWHLTESENNTLSSTLLRFIAHADINVRRGAYSHLHHLVIAGLGVQHAQQSPAEALAFLLFNTSLLLEITTHGIASTDNVVQNCAEDIILHALKGRFLLGAAHWNQFLVSLEPVLPLLQCWSDKPSALGRSIITMLNPDVGSQMSLGSAELLKGNLRLLFSRDEHVRREALSRLVWLLTKEDDAFSKLPHIATLHNCAADSICFVEKPVDVFRLVPEQSFYQESSLLQVLDIVKSSGLEPQMLVSALTQVAAMLEDPRHHETFLSRGGLSLAIEYLNAAVSEKRYEIYPEVTVPLVSILKSLSLHHTISRHQLAKTVNVFYSILRGLVLFPSDLHLRTNASQLLCVLLYNDIIISSSPRTLPDGFAVRGLSIPHLVECRMKLPILCPTHWRTSHYTEPLMTDILLRRQECRSFLATIWNLNYFKFQQSPVLWDSGNVPKQVSNAQKNFSSSLFLDHLNLQILQASSMLSLCEKQLKSIQEASSHSDVSKSVNILRSVLDLFKMVKEKTQIADRSSSDTADFRNSYKSLPWRQTFRRFLMAAPASIEDQLLLVQILSFFKLHVSVSLSLGLHYKDGRWLTKKLQHPSQPLPNLFHTVAHTGYTGDNTMPQELAHLPKWKELCKVLLGVMTECARFEHTSACWTESIPKLQADVSSDLQDDEKQKLTKSSKVKSSQQSSVSSKKNSDLERADGWVGEVLSGASDGMQPAAYTFWTHVIRIIVNCLKSSDTQHFYNLAYLDWLLWTLTRLTDKHGWSSLLTPLERKSLFAEVLGILLELVQAFHLECGKGGSSYMGLSITRASILCLNHILEEMQQFQESKWEDLWCEATRKASRGAFHVQWLPSLFQSRDPIVRAAALQLASVVSHTPHGCGDVVGMLTDHPNAWMTPLCILLDHDEASIVREQAVNFLTNLVKSRIGPSGLAKNVFEASGFEALLQRLSLDGFLSEVFTLLERLCLATFCELSYFSSQASGVGLEHWSVAGGTLERRNFAHLPTDQYVIVNIGRGCEKDCHSTPCTPALISGVCNFLDSVGEISNDILASFVKLGLPARLMRCVNSIPPLDPHSERASHLYCDTLRMYARLCHLVSQCVSCDVVSCWHILQQPQSYHKLLLLLDPALFYVDPPSVLILRNELWTEVLWLLSRLLSASTGTDICREEKEHSILHSLLIRSRGEPLASVLTIALSGTLLTNLQRAALACIQSLLCHPASKMGLPFAVLLDDLNADFNASVVTVKEVNLENAIGASLCRSLLALYDVHSLQMGTADKSTSVGSDWQAQRSSVGGALSSLLQASVSAKDVALKQGLVELLCAQLGAIQSYLILEPGETMKRLATRKKVCPILKDLELILGILNSTLWKNVIAKELASDVGATDTIHKLWTWCQAQPNLLQTALRFLATLTSGCPSASHTLVLTTSVPGLGLRRTPSVQSLLHALVALVLQETELVTHAHDLTVLILTCNVLSNACHVPECRSALTKGNLLKGVHHLHSGVNKKSKQKSAVERVWLSLLNQLSGYQEGQVVLPKVPDLLEYLICLAEDQKKNSKLALNILRNIAFSSINRPRLLASGEFLLLINKKLREGDTDEQVAAGAALWALVANNQKGKLTVKCAGLDMQILDSLRQLAVCQRPGADFVAQLLNCVLRIIRHEPLSSTGRSS